MQGFMFQASIYLAAAVIAVPLAARLGLGSVLGYLMAGIVIGPVLGVVGDTQNLQHFAEFGVVMMLFLIGLELDPRALWAMRHKLIGLGGLQLVLTTSLIMAGGMAFGLVWSVALAVGMVFALSSTAIVLQTLSEKGLMQTSGGRSTFSVLLTQDIAVIPMLALLPLLAIQQTAIGGDGSIRRATSVVPQASGHDAAAGGHGPEAAMSLVEGLPGWGVTLVTLGMVGAVIFAGVYLARPVFRYIHSARLPEMFTALALLIVIGIGFLMVSVGLSPALGTFLAGVVLANSEFRHELESHIEPFKGLLLGLFFITVGAGINYHVLLRDPLIIVGLTLAVIAIKMAVLYLLSLIFRMKGRSRWLFTLGLAQAGEFGFVLTSFSVQQHVLPAALSEKLLLVIALSMLITPLLFILYEVIARRPGDNIEPIGEDEIDEKGTVIICGVGRFGQVVNRLVQSTGHKTVVLDNDLKTIEVMRRFGFKAFFGDPSRPEILHAAGLDEAKVLVVAIDNPDAAVRLVKYARKSRPDLHIIVRAYDRTHVYRLYKAGANDIVREMFDSSLRAGRYVLENMGLNEYEAAAAEKLFYHHDRDAMRELAEVWKPKVASADNPEYIERTKHLEKELQAALMAQLEGLGKAG